LTNPESWSIDLYTRGPLIVKNLVKRKTST
jgi:hypothetical protein